MAAPQRQGLSPLLRLATVGSDLLSYYHKPATSTHTHLPCILFVSGYNSTIQTGVKSNYLAALCLEHGLGYLAYDHFGHGNSSGTLADGTVSRWRDDLLRLLDSPLCRGRPQLLVGSSLGCWIGLLAAKLRPSQIVGIVGIAGAPNFTKGIRERISPELIENARNSDGIVWLPSQYEPKGFPFSLRLLDDGAQNLITEKWPVGAPVYLIHGMKDEAVPYQTSVDVANMVEASDVKVLLVKDGEHTMSRKEDLEQLGKVVLEMVAKVS
ncbi:hypothetical protein SeMB42_g04500 [Synchytrium endobioticum]|uniref:Palmitoyl-protein thioesterase ABHD10, mitochondrial n=1 Tax=Synchytrium endobioticum TaxID=286115 RepID=A0A507DGG6_9FUNG|nr:hypothetical protein SeMB42_g04500 [Synchytrium endobioticum]TPX50337.1 hypothetical protein SeLEV6574_g00956 [Synchytrium endobioticum]